MPDLEKCPFCNASPFEDVVYGIKYAVCHTVDCAIHGKCIPVIKWQDRAKVEAVHSTSTNKAMFQLPDTKEMVRKFSARYNGFNDVGLYTRSIIMNVLDILLQQQHS